MGTYFLAPTQNHLQKTLSGGISDSVTTITLNNTTSLLAPGYIVIDRENSAGTATPNSREVVYYTGISGSDLTGCVRGADGSTNRTHSDGAIVETFPSVGMWNNLVTISSTAFDSNGYLKAIASPVSIARMQIIQESITSIASVAQLHLSSGYISNMTVTGSINASGASVIGVFPSGASGAVLTSIGSTQPPVMATTSRLSSKVKLIIRDIAGTSGDVSYTGIGFVPTAIEFAYGTLDAKCSGAGFVDSGSSMVSYFNATVTGYVTGDVTNDKCIYVSNQTGTNQTAVIKTFDSDGFTLTWTKTGSPTGTAHIVAICYR